MPPGRLAAPDPLERDPLSRDTPKRDTPNRDTLNRDTPNRDNVLELLRPGSFVRLLDQPHDLPPFQLIHCRGGRCWVRQQSWGPFLHWEVAHRRLGRIA